MKRVILLLTCLYLKGSDELFEAARKGETAAVKAQLDKGVDVNAKWRYDQTALFIAASRGHDDVVKLLLDRGATINVKDSFYGMTAVSAALFRNHYDTAQLLVAKGAEGKEELLQAAAGAGKVDVVKFVLSSGGLKPESLSSALSAAGRGNHPEVVDLLKKAGAVVAAQPNFKVDPAVLARYAGAYRNEGGLELKFEVKDGKFYAVMAGQSQEYAAFDEKTFEPVQYPGTFKIVFDVSADTVSGFEIRQGSNVQKFKRVEAK